LRACRSSWRLLRLPAPRLPIPRGEEAGEMAVAHWLPPPAILAIFCRDEPAFGEAKHFAGDLSALDAGHIGEDSRSRYHPGAPWYAQPLAPVLVGPGAGGGHGVDSSVEEFSDSSS